VFSKRQKKENSEKENNEAHEREREKSDLFQAFFFLEL
jgi:hypothetical protein